MIRSLRHKGLKLLYDKDDGRRLPADKPDRIRQILLQLDTAANLRDLDIVTFKLHALKGDLKGFWAITVRANRRIIFRFVDGDAVDVDLVDYH